MITKIGKLFFILLIAFFMVAPGIALAKKPNARKGKYLFRKYCRTCHKEGASAKALSPVSKTQAEWDKLFKNYTNLACADEWAKRKEKEIKDMHAHLWGHAYDSPSPAKCE